jgi:hypothetical protein
MGLILYTHLIGVPQPVGIDQIIYHHQFTTQATMAAL